MVNESNADNEMYRKVMEEDRINFCPFRKEYQMEVIESHLKLDLQNREGVSMLEAACGQGRLLYYLSQFDPKQNYSGFDYSQTFVNDASNLFKDSQNVACFYGDIYKLPMTMTKQYDITFLYKTLYCIPDYPSVFKSLVSVTREKIYITTPLYEGDIDFEIKMKPYKVYKGEEDYVMYYIYSLPKVEACLFELGAKAVTFHELKLPIDLPKPTNLDVLQTYTVRTVDGDNIELTNIIKLDWKLIEIAL